MRLVGLHAVALPHRRRQCPVFPMVPTDRKAHWIAKAGNSSRATDPTWNGCYFDAEVWTKERLHDPNRFETQTGNGLKIKPESVRNSNRNYTYSTTPNEQALAQVSAPTGFETWYAVYARKVAKKRAKDAYPKAIKRLAKSCGISTAEGEPLLVDLTTGHISFFC